MPKGKSKPLGRSFHEHRLLCKPTTLRSGVYVGQRVSLSGLSKAKIKVKTRTLGRYPQSPFRLPTKNATQGGILS